MCYDKKSIDEIEIEKTTWKEGMIIDAKKRERS
jgi:hypothetical protein